MTLVLDQSAGGNLVNTATVSGAEAELDTSDNTVSSTISVTPLADLELKRTDLLESNPMILNTKTTRSSASLRSQTTNPRMRQT